MTEDELRKYIQQKRLEQIKSTDDNRARKEHLKRQYIRLHHMQRKVQDRKKLEEITRMKRQMLNLITKD